jgi:hypothetical protein
MNRILALQKLQALGIFLLGVDGQGTVRTTGSSCSYEGCSIVTTEPMMAAPPED